MKLYILAAGSKRVRVAAIQNDKLPMVAIGGGRKVASNRKSCCCNNRLVLPVAVVLGVLFPFVFFGFAFSILEAPLCDSFDCSLWKFLGRSDEYLGVKLREELIRALLDVSGRKGHGVLEESRSMDNSVESFNELAINIMSSTKDIRDIAFKTRAMLHKIEKEAKAAKRREAIFWHLASRGVPKSLHCLTLSLDEEYALDSRARSHLPSPEYFPRLADSLLQHIVLLTDNVLAASVAVTSTIQNSANPETLVFHIVTDKKTYFAMHAWFATNAIESAIVEIKGLHQYYWSPEMNAELEGGLDIHRSIWAQYYKGVQQVGTDFDERQEKKFDDLISLSYPSLMSHLRMYIPELFPDLKRIVFLDDDVVVQDDISALWDMDLNGKVIGAVVDLWSRDNCCLGRKYIDYFNFSDPIIQAKFSAGECGWLLGMNIMDLQAWRDSNITKTYHHWLKLNLDSGLQLWRPGVLPPFLLAFRGHVHPLDPKWHLAGLGQRFPKVNSEQLEAAAVVHFSGPAKPWLEISNFEVRRMWVRHVNFSNGFIRKCNFVGDKGKVLSPTSIY